MFPLLLQAKESTANCPEEVALATVWELAVAAREPSVGLHGHREHQCSAKVVFQALWFVDSFVSEGSSCHHRR